MEVAQVIMQLAGHQELLKAEIARIEHDMSTLVELSRRYPEDKALFTSPHRDLAKVKKEKSEQEKEIRLHLQCYELHRPSGEKILQKINKAQQSKTSSFGGGATMTTTAIAAPHDQPSNVFSVTDDKKRKQRQNSAQATSSTTSSFVPSDARMTKRGGGASNVTNTSGSTSYLRQEQSSFGPQQQRATQRSMQTQSSITATDSALTAESRSTSASLASSSVMLTTQPPPPAAFQERDLAPYRNHQRPPRPEVAHEYPQQLQQLGRGSGHYPFAREGMLHQQQQQQHNENNNAIAPLGFLHGGSGGASYPSSGYSAHPSYGYSNNDQQHQQLQYQPPHPHHHIDPLGVATHTTLGTSAPNDYYNNGMDRYFPSGVSAGLVPPSFAFESAPPPAPLGHYQQMHRGRDDVVDVTSSEGGHDRLMNSSLQ